MEADRLGFRQLFMVKHHFTGHGQVSALVGTSQADSPWGDARGRHSGVSTPAPINRMPRCYFSPCAAVAARKMPPRGWSHNQITNAHGRELQRVRRARD
jgi:hypothetical protein